MSSSSSSRKRTYYSLSARSRAHQAGHAASAPAASGGTGHHDSQHHHSQQQPWHQSIALNRDVIRRMLLNEPMELPFVVKLAETRRTVPSHDDNDNEGGMKQCSSSTSTATAAVATLCDDSHTQEVVLLNHCERELLEQGACSLIVSIHGYVTSMCNSASTGYLAITDLRVLQSHKKEASITRSTPNLGMERSLQGGHFASFLQDQVPFFSNEDLAGREHDFGGSSFAESVQCVSKCLGHHAAMLTLQSSSHAAASTAAAVTTATTDFYQQALQEFATSQLDRQKASLTSNAGREDATRSHLVVDKYCEALNVALSSTSGTFLTAARLQEWHGIICGDRLHAQAGRFRTTNVRVGCTSFCPAERLPQEVERLMQGLKSLHSRLFFHNSSVGTIPSGDDLHHLGWRAITFATAVVFGLLDIHPFADGNGRLSRVAMNWALKYAGLPFVVNLFATPAQRNEYVTAILQTRRNTTLVARGNVSDEAFHEAYCSAGMLYPLMEVIADRVARAALEFRKLYEEKSKLASEQEEARAARVFRERAALGSCLICLDEKPNIATLCCGKAVHLNCIAEWLSLNNSCPQCRVEMPALLPTTRAAARSSPNAAANEIDDTTSTVDDDDDDDHNNNNIHAEDDTNESDDTTDDDTTYAAFIRNNNGNNNNNNQDDDTTEEIEDIADTTEEVNNSYRAPQPVFCGHYGCRNKAAVDCSVGYCGRCCVLFGSLSCERHNH